MVFAFNVPARLVARTPPRTPVAAAKLSTRNVVHVLRVFCGKAILRGGLEAVKLVFLVLLDRSRRKVGL